MLRVFIHSYLSTDYASCHVLLRAVSIFVTHSYSLLAEVCRAASFIHIICILCYLAGTPPRCEFCSVFFASVGCVGGRYSSDITCICVTVCVPCDISISITWVLLLWYYILYLFILYTSYPALQVL